MAAVPLWLQYVAAGIFGACVGSFLNVCIQRMPYGESVVWPPSHCRRCNRRISWWENVPLVSYIILLGRCRSCGGLISPLYFIVELTASALSLAVWAHLGDAILYIAYFLLLIAPLIVVTFIDLEHRIIPNVITLPGIAAGIGVHLLEAGKTHAWYAVSDSVIGAVVGAGFLFIVAMAYERIKKREGLGMGDVKLAAMLGAFFGWRGVIFILLMGSLIGSLTGIAVILTKRKGLAWEIPFGPFLSTAAIIYFFFGTDLIGWYLNLFF